MMKNEFERVSVDFGLCMHCGACVGTCPKGAMCLEDLTVWVDERCNGCGLCVIVCPIGAIEKCPQGDER